MVIKELSDDEDRIFLAASSPSPSFNTVPSSQAGDPTGLSSTPPARVLRLG
jgi:hypothetical protein